MALALSVLDLVPLSEGSTSVAALLGATRLAVAVDRLGYTRLWYAEHHNLPGIATTTPEILIAHVGSMTSRIRLGAGGVMLPNHSPLQVAESYKLLEAIHPGRIDLGIGRAPGTDPLTALALRRSRKALTADDFLEQLGELIAWGAANFRRAIRFAGFARCLTIGRCRRFSFSAQAITERSWRRRWELDSRSRDISVWTRRIIRCGLTAAVFLLAVCSRNRTRSWRSRFFALRRRKRLRGWLRRCCFRSLNCGLGTRPNA